jgi:hypothetical protein
MPAPIPDSNIQEKLKTPNKKRAAKPRTKALPAPPEARVAALAALLRSPGYLGQLLRVLARLLRDPGKSPTSQDLEMLLLLTVALERAGMWR